MKSINLILLSLTTLVMGSKIISNDNSNFPNTNGIGISTAPGLLKKCGDGSLFFVSEECDDGNNIDGDGCSDCKVEVGWICTKQRFKKSVCSKFCGNGKLQQNQGQECDDGNVNFGDGCSNCKIEKGWHCTKLNMQKSTCQRYCGNGQLNIDQQQICDDGNQNSGDGCFNCQVETGWSCTKQNLQKSTCQLLCGNGKLDEGQQCQYTLPGKLCTRNCVKDLNKIQTCQNGNLQEGQLCESSYSYGCYNCIYQSPNAICPVIHHQQTQYSQAYEQHFCALKCSINSQVQYYKQGKALMTLINIWINGQQKLQQLGITIPQASQQDYYKLAKVNNVNLTFTKSLYPFTIQSLTQTQIQSDDFIFALYYYIQIFLQTDQEGNKILRWNYVDDGSYLSQVFKYGVQQVNNQQNCVILKPTVVNWNDYL